MPSVVPRLSAFVSNYKKRSDLNKAHLARRLRQLFNTAVTNFENSTRERPNTVFTSLFIMNTIAIDKQQVVTLQDEGQKYHYLYGFRIVPTRVNIIVAAICDSPEVIQHDLEEINDKDYDLVKELDQEYILTDSTLKPVLGVSV